MSKKLLPPDTPEQALITNFKGQKLVVRAYAGTGKTTTLEKFALSNPNTRMLYLAFQRSVAEEGRARFPKNVVCRTSHQIAYAAVGKNYRHKQKGGIPLEEVARVIGERNWKVIKDIISTLNAYMTSSDKYILTGHTPNEEAPRVLSAPELKYKGHLVEIAELLWQKMIDPEDPFTMTHDGYLKLYQLSEPDLALRYGCILFDEAQDANPVTTALVIRQRCQLIFVGDPHQQIYRFRGANNALEIPDMSDATHLKLTNSFRFGQEVALVANAILSLKEESTPLIGRGMQDEIYVTMPEQVGHIAILHRTVMGTIQSAMEAAAKGQKVYWLGGHKSYQVENVLDVYWLNQGKCENVKNKRLLAMCNGQFSNYVQMAKDTGDHEMRRALQLIKDPRLLKHLQALSDLTVEDEKDADITVSTVHKAKGLEWENVILSNDFPDLFALQDKSDVWCDEVNLLYVAVTRAMKRLAVNEIVEMVLRKTLLDQQHTVSTTPA